MRTARLGVLLNIAIFFMPKGDSCTLLLSKDERGIVRNPKANQLFSRLSFGSMAFCFFQKAEGCPGIETKDPRWNKQQNSKQKGAKTGSCM